MITGLNHMSLSVSDLDKSFIFYKEVLGFKPLVKWPGGAYLLAGETWFCLFPSTKVKVDESYTHFAFSVDEEVFKSLSERIQSSTKLWQDNVSEGDSLYFLDPDGYRLEIHVGDWQSRLATKKANPWPNAEFYA